MKAEWIWARQTWPQYPAVKVGTVNRPHLVESRTYQQTPDPWLRIGLKEELGKSHVRSQLPLVSELTKPWSNPGQTRLQYIPSTYE